MKAASVDTGRVGRRAKARSILTSKTLREGSGGFGRGGAHALGTVSEEAEYIDSASSLGLGEDRWLR